MFLTEEYYTFVPTLLSPQPTQEMHTSHIYIGFAGELVELLSYENHNNYIEEIGDCLFYLTAIIKNTNLEGYMLEPSYTEQDVISINEHFFYEQIRELLSLVIDDLKKEIFYKQPTSKINKVLSVSEYVNRFTSLFTENTITTAMFTNVSKLKKRYPNAQFTIQDSIVRADKCQQD